METFLEILDETEKFLKEKSIKMLLIWKVLGLVFLGFFFILSYVYCGSIKSLVVAGFGLVVLVLSWVLIYLGLKKHSVTCLGDTKLLRLLILMNRYNTDSILFDAFEIRAFGESRKKTDDLKKIKDMIVTDEVNKKLEEFIKRNNITLEDGERKSIWDQ